jgi:hypothetical protein
LSDLGAIPVDQLAWALADALGRASHARYQGTKADEEAAAIRAELGRRLTVGEVVPVDESTQVVCLPGRAGIRSVDRDAVLRHVEALEPLGLVPREEIRLAWPTVAQVTAAEYALKRLGIDPGELLTTPPAGAPRIEVRSVKASEEVRTP